MRGGLGVADGRATLACGAGKGGGGAAVALAASDGGSGGGVGAGTGATGSGIAGKAILVPMSAAIGCSGAGGGADSGPSRAAPRAVTSTSPSPMGATRHASEALVVVGGALFPVRRTRADRADFLSAYRLSDQRHTTCDFRLPPRADSISLMCM